MQYTQQTAQRKRGPGKRKCDRCQRPHKPLSESVRYCGACSAKLLSRISWQGLWR